MAIPALVAPLSTSPTGVPARASGASYPWANPSRTRLAVLGVDVGPQHVLRAP